MSKILTREEKLVLPDWEEVYEYIHNPTNKGKTLFLCEFMNNGNIYHMTVNELEIVIYTRSSKTGSLWKNFDYRKTNENNYNIMCEILTKIWKGE